MDDGNGEVDQVRPLALQPIEDPHGHPIPSSTGELRHRELRRVSEFRGGDHVVIREAQDDNPDRLRGDHVHALPRLKPGALLEG